MLAKELSDYDVVNVGAAGTFVVRKPNVQSKLRTELLRRLPFEAEVVLCKGHDILDLLLQNPFSSEPPRPDIVQFVSVATRTFRIQPRLPIALPASENWLVRILGSKGRFVFGVYRRHMKTIGYLGTIDKLLGAPVTTRNWNTVLAVTRVLKNNVART